MLNPDKASESFWSPAPGKVGNPGNPTCLAISWKGDQKESSSKKDLKIIQFSAKHLPSSINSTGTQERKSGAIWELCFAQFFCLLEIETTWQWQWDRAFPAQWGLPWMGTLLLPAHNLLAPALLNNPTEMSPVATGWVSTPGTWEFSPSPKGKSFLSCLWWSSWEIVASRKASSSLEKAALST